MKKKGNSNNRPACKYVQIEKSLNILWFLNLIGKVYF